MDFIDCVSECAKNIIKGNVPLNPAQLRRLRRERSNVRVLALKKTSLKKKRRVLQKGGFLGALLPPVLGVLGSLLLGNANRYKIGARRSTVSGTGESRQKVQADTETGRFPSQNGSESRYCQNFKRRYAVRRPKSRSLFADSEQILSGDRRSTTADDF